MLRHNIDHVTAQQQFGTWQDRDRVGWGYGMVGESGHKELGAWMSCRFDGYLHLLGLLHLYLCHEASGPVPVSLHGLRPLRCPSFQEVSV